MSKCRMWTKKTLARKQIFVQTPFSLYFKIRAKKISNPKATRFIAPLPISEWPKSLLQFDSQWIMKMCEQIFKNKQHSSTSPKIQSKELNEKIRSILPDQQIIWTMPAKTQTKSSKISKTKTIKQTEQKHTLLKLLAKTLEAFTTETQLNPFKCTDHKKLFKAEFYLWNGSRIISARLEKIHQPLKID